VAELLDRPSPRAVPIVEPDGTIFVPPATAEVRVLEAVQGTLAAPSVVRVARGMSVFGEHALGWLAMGALGALVDRSGWCAGRDRTIRVSRCTSARPAG